MSVRIQIRRDTGTNWSSANTVLAEGEIGLNTTNDRYKIGDGTTAWNNLLYAAIDETFLEERLAEEHWHHPVRLATAAVLPNTPTYTAGTTDEDGGTGIGAKLESSSNARLSVDGVEAVTGNRVLVKNQANAIHNGVYDVTAQGSGSAHWILTRASDMNGSIAGQISVGENVGVREGTNNYYQQFAISSTGTGTGGIHVIGTDEITFVQWSGVASFNVGNGLTATGNTLNVVTASADRIIVNADSIDLPTITQNNSTNVATNTFVSNVTRDGYGRVTGVEKSDVALTLGTHTSGDYVASLVAGTGVTLTNNSGETATPTVAIGQSVATSASVTFASVTAPLTGNASTATTLQTPRNIAGQSFNGSADISIAPTDLTGVTATASEINTLDGITSSTAELNILDGATLSTTELNYVDGVTSSIQTQIDSKAPTNSPTFTGTVVLPDNTVALGTKTTGDYVASLVAGTGVTLTNNSGEGATPTVAIGQAVGTTSSVLFATAETTGNLTVGGDIYVNGTYFTTTETSLAIQDPFIYLNDGSTVTNPDLGIAGNYNDGTYRHAGVFRDATDGKWKFFDSYTPEPNSPIDTGHGTYAPATVVAKSIESTVSTGTAPLTVASTTAVTNLNADLLDGQHGSYYAPTANPTFTGTVATSSITASATPGLTLSNSSGDEGGEMLLSKPATNTSIAGTGVTIDVYRNQLRIFEQGGNARGVYIDLTACNNSVGTNLLGDVVTSAQTASYTLTLQDKGDLVEMLVGSANNLTVPPNSSVPFPIGTQINILQTGTGQTTVVAGSGVTVNATPGLKIRAQWSYATLIKRGTDTWVLVGDISA